MKRTITSLILFSFLLSPIHLLSAQEVEPQSEESFQSSVFTSANDSQYFKFTSNPATIFPMTNAIIMVEPTGGLNIDMENAYIIWYIDGIYKTSGRGLDTYNLNTSTDLTPIKFGVRVNYTENGTLRSYTAAFTVNPRLPTGKKVEKEKLIPVSAQENPTLIIRTSPSHPRVYQKITFTVVSTDSACDVTNQPILWKINGKEVEPEAVGRHTVTARISSSYDDTEVNVKVGSCGQNTYTFVAESDTAKLSTAGPKRVLDCEAQYLRMLGSRYQSITNEYNSIKDKIQDTTDSIAEDMSFLGSITDIEDDWAETVVMMGLAQDTAGKGDTITEKIANKAKAITIFAKIFTESPIAKKIAYIKKKKRYYERITKYYENLPERLQAMEESTINQIKNSQKRCVELANQPIKNPI